MGKSSGHPSRSIIGILLFVHLLSAQAAELPGGLVIDLRYRLAHIDEAGYADPANANTLRVTLGYLWKFEQYWSAYAEGTRVVGLFGDDYNSGANGKTGLPAEGDPPSSEISSAWLGYDNGTLQARLGRQYVNLDNQRFFTSGLWRQNPQSFDAWSSSWQLDSGTTLKYLYLDEAHRSVGHDYPDPTQSEWSLNGNLIHIDQELPLGQLTGYDYLIDNYTQPKDSWRTAGLRWTGNHTFHSTALNWTAEFAQQSSWRNNPERYTADYHLLELSFGFSWASLLLGDEVLGGNGRYAFSSPYGSNHGFNGWTSQFKSVPKNGLDDRYARGFGKVTERLGWTVTAHNFFAQHGTQRYGSEVDTGLSYAMRKDLGIELDYANYHSNGFGSSERELWFALEYRHSNPGGD